MYKLYLSTNPSKILFESEYLDDAETQLEKIFDEYVQLFRKIENRASIDDKSVNLLKTALSDAHIVFEFENSILAMFTIRYAKKLGHRLSEHDSEEQQDRANEPEEIFTY